MLPNFIVIGAPKCGTTSICDLLSKHPDIFICSPKEPRFFSHDNIFSRGFQWYESLFKSAKGKKAIGEGSTSYSTSSRGRKSAERISDAIPDARIIYCVRNPIRRIESIWMQHHFTIGFNGHGFNEGKVSQDFNADVVANPNFIDTSRYWERIDTYRKKFSDDRIFIVFLEDLKSDPHRVLSECFSFLEVDPNIKILDADRPRLVSKDRTIATPLGAALKRLPGLKLLKNFLPNSILVALRLKEHPFKNRPRWNSKTYHHVIHRLDKDVFSFLSYCGKPTDFWKLDMNDPTNDMTT